MNINNPWENNFEKKLEINEILENLKNETKIDIEYTLLIETYKEFLKRIIPELQKIWLEVDEGWSLDFKNLINYWQVLKINWKNLRNFPNQTFNKKHWIWNKNWYISSKKNLIELFNFFWFQVK